MRMIPPDGRSASRTRVEQAPTALRSFALGRGLRADTVETIGSDVASTIFPAGAVIAIGLEGQADVTVGRETLTVTSDPAGPATGLVLSRPEAMVLHRTDRRRGLTVLVSLASERLATASPMERPHRARRGQPQHIGTTLFLPADAVRFARTITSLERAPGPIESLLLESQALALFSLMPERLLTATLAAAPASHADCLQHACRFLDANLDRNISLARIARHAGTNPNTLQRRFREAFGMTLFEYLRLQRIRQARTAIETDGISVGEAARIAGYGSAANFATAFRRHFGITPTQARRRE